MGELRHFTRILSGGRLRWAPAGVLVVAGSVLAGTMLPTSASPVLPRRTAVQILAGIRQATLPKAMTAVVSETASLGLPALPDIGGVAPSALSALALLSGTHTVQIWYAGPRHLRIALPVSFGETDLRVNGNQAWLWDSHGQTATRYILPAPSARVALPGKAGALPAPMTPIQAARRVLALAGPTTRVGVAGTTTVAGRPAYQLTIAPRTSQSLIDHIVIAVDAASYLPLQVQVFARGSSGPAFQIGFTSVAFTRPASSNFTFVPPAGAHLKTVRVPAPAAKPALPAKPSSSAKPNRAGLAGTRVLGSGWLSVAVIPVAKAPTQISSLLPALLSAAALKHGTWGSGRLLQTGLVNVLVTSKGQILVGAVTPTVLYADAAKVS